jgi:flagellar hook-length control protein FliK
MLDKPDSIDQGASNAQTSDQPKDQGAPAQAATSSKPAADSVEPVPGASAKAATSPDVTTPDAQPIETSVTETPATEQEIADFLAAVAAATGMPIKPVSQPNADDKLTETKPDDQEDDAAAVTADLATIPSVEVKSADAAAIVVMTPADATVAAPDETAAKSTGIVAVTVEQAAAPVVAEDTVAVPGETKDAKPQVVAKADAPVPPPNLAPDSTTSETAKQANPQQPANPQAAQAAAAQPQGQAPKPEAPTQAVKPAPAQHDVRALDAAPTKPADNVQPMLLMQAHAAAPTADQAALTQAPATAAPQAVALPVAGIAIEIAGKAMAGKNRFEIRLDPPELGRIHVRLDVDHKGEVTSIITADRSDTFDLLRRDAQQLERALQDAGVKTANNGLQFSLRDQGAGRHDQPAFTDSARVIVRDDNLDTDIIAPVYRSLPGNRAGVDIRV